LSVDGAYGPGTFVRGVDTCVPTNFPTTYNGSIAISGNGTVLQLAEQQTRISLGSVVNNVGTYAGSGFYGGQAATWITVIEFSAPGGCVLATVSETIRLTNVGNCGTTYASGTLTKRNS
jgi:hypothetical protein